MTSRVTGRVGAGDAARLLRSRHPGRVLLAFTAAAVRGAVRGQAVLKAASGIDPWVAAGHSMGASMAARFVHDEPRQSCGLMLPGTHSPTG